LSSDYPTWKEFVSSAEDIKNGIIWVIYGHFLKRIGDIVDWGKYIKPDESEDLSQIALSLWNKGDQIILDGAKKLEDIKDEFYDEIMIGIGINVGLSGEVIKCINVKPYSGGFNIAMTLGTALQIWETATVFDLPIPVDTNKYHISGSLEVSSEISGEIPITYAATSGIVEAGPFGSFDTTKRMLTVDFDAILG
jgi:hypothetical protein